MPTLKIGCRVTYKDQGEAILTDYKSGNSKPWLLKTRSGLVWASHHEFRGNEAMRYGAAASSVREMGAKSAKGIAVAGSFARVLGAVFRPRAQITSHV